MEGESQMTYKRSKFDNTVIIHIDLTDLFDGTESYLEATHRPPMELECTEL